MRQFLQLNFCKMKGVFLIRIRSSHKLNMRRSVPLPPLEKIWQQILQSRRRMSFLIHRKKWRAFLNAKISQEKAAIKHERFQTSSLHIFSSSYFNFLQCKRRPTVALRLIRSNTGQCSLNWQSRVHDVGRSGYVTEDQGARTWELGGRRGKGHLDCSNRC